MLRKTGDRMQCTQKWLLWRACLLMLTVSRGAPGRAGEGRYSSWTECGAGRVRAAWDWEQNLESAARCLATCKAAHRARGHQPMRQCTHKRVRYVASSSFTLFKEHPPCRHLRSPAVRTIAALSEPPVTTAHSQRRCFCVVPSLAVADTRVHAVCKALRTASACTTRNVKPLPRQREQRLDSVATGSPLSLCLGMPAVLLIDWQPAPEPWGSRLKPRILDKGAAESGPNHSLRQSLDYRYLPYTNAQFPYLLVINMRQ